MMINFLGFMTHFATKYVDIHISRLMCFVLIGLALEVLWPCLHYAVPDAPKTKVFYESSSFTHVCIYGYLFNHLAYIYTVSSL